VRNLQGTIQFLPSCTVSYSWVTGAYGTCSAACGGGTQGRTVVCKDNSGNTVNDSFCTATKPAVTSDCNTDACSMACKDAGILESSNDICTGYTYGNAWLYAVYPNGVSGASEWWQGNVPNQ